MMMELLSLVFNMSITASIIIPAVLVIRALLGRAPKVFSYALWGIVLFRLLCPISFAAPFSLLNLTGTSAERSGELRYFSVAPAESASAQSSEADGYAGGADVQIYPGASKITAADGGTEGAKDPHASANPAVGSWIKDQQSRDPVSYVRQTDGAEAESAGKLPGKADAPAPKKRAVTLTNVLATVWILGIFLLAAVNFAAYLRLRAKLACALKWKENIYLADEIGTPFCIGIFRPRIYLPSSLDEAERKFVIWHEWHHICRGDHVIKPVAFAALCIHWFNPLVWLAFLLAGRDMEMSCDEAVMRRMDGDVRAAYSATLLNLATGKRILTVSPIAFGDGDPKQRIRNVMNYKKPGLWAVAAALIVCVAASGCLLSNPKAGGTEKEEPASKRETIEIAGAQQIEPEENGGIPGGETLQETDAPQEKTSEEKLPEEISGGRDDETSRVQELEALAESVQEELTAEKESLERSQELPDIDGSGQKEYVVIRSPEAEEGHFDFYFNGEKIFEFDDPCAIDSVYAEYLDLDRDGRSEIFLRILPRVNSMPLEEYAVLKYRQGGWEKLETYQGGNVTDNAFPIRIGKTGKGYEVVLSCDGLDKRITADLAWCYQNWKELTKKDGGSAEVMVQSYEQYFMEENCGAVCAWGIWEIEASYYGGAPCLIARHGIQGFDKMDGWGVADVWFDYDENGKIRVLDLEFFPYEEQQTFSETVYTGDTPWEAYRQIADLYYRAAAAVKEAEGDPSDAFAEAAGGAYVCSEYQAARDKNAVPVYLLYDLNGDGTDEFFMGLRFDYDHSEPYYCIYDVYTWKNGRTFQLMREIGYRVGTCEIMEGGVIRDRYSGSAWDYGERYHILPPGGTKLRTVYEQYAVLNAERGESDFYNAAGEKITGEIYQETSERYVSADVQFQEYHPNQR